MGVSMIWAKIFSRVKLQFKWGLGVIEMPKENMAQEIEIDSTLG